MQENHTFFNDKSQFYIDNINDEKILNFQIKKEVFMKYLNINFYILYSKKLSSNEKIIFSAIYALDNEKGCYEGNQFFADLVNVSPKTASTLVNNLKRKNLVTIRFLQEKGDVRIIHVSPNIKKEILDNLDTITQKSGIGIPENKDTYSLKQGR